MKKSMLKSKTFWTSILGSVAAIAKACGVPIPTEAILALWPLIAIFLRMGVEENKSPVTGKPY